MGYAAPGDEKSHKSPQIRVLSQSVSKELPDTVTKTVFGDVTLKTALYTSLHNFQVTVNG
jgi:hypothetical protein